MSSTRLTFHALMSLLKASALLNIDLYVHTQQRHARTEEEGESGRGRKEGTLSDHTTRTHTRPPAHTPPQPSVMHIHAPLPPAYCTLTLAPTYPLTRRPRRAVMGCGVMAGEGGRCAREGAATYSMSVTRLTSHVLMSLLKS